MDGAAAYGDWMGLNGMVDNSQKPKSGYEVNIPTVWLGMFTRGTRVP